MKKMFYLFFVILTAGSCKSVYLSTTGEIMSINEESIVVSFPCANSKRVGCKGWATFEKKKFPNACIGQKIELK